MRIRATRTRAVASTAVGLLAAVTVAACSATSTSDAPPSTQAPPGTNSTATASATPGATATGMASPGGSVPGGSFTAPKSACDLVDVAALERVSGRSGLELRNVSSGTQLACAVTDGFVPVGAVTLAIREAPAGVDARKELDDTVAASEYGRDNVQEIPGLGAAARYGTSPSIAGLTFASIYVIDLRGSQLASLSISIDAGDPATAKDPVVTLARDALAKI
ncbi:hypothetical protein I6A84_13580 [Frankia sp. CNm7]|uniref:DUF3558 domain-containing protein n=1 Tax=Frankia nepalensis TaxID=1836974 RepID=A0A937RBV5_9ACTN|nr:hypothetical protein [Frankia nepalensis]MBL7496942.1 hypothetical protein [Frankia nepalensis]MBL7513432.1 hypothetical protein [Frankia nepalensis]MBL7519109.1 hypothetical protein [Frankia nepalensis]MBL7626125.1 hypothetical protein [Frankia nepalensis]